MEKRADSNSSRNTSVKLAVLSAPYMTASDTGVVTAPGPAEATTP
jgi:hypothetical protein